MTEEVTFKQPPAQEKSQPAIKRFQGRSVGGQITNVIGSGDEAKNSFIWVTIRWSFFIGSAISMGVFLRPVLFCQPEATTDFVESVKSVWTIFLPVITLALGYSFGKGR